MLVNINILHSAQIALLARTLNNERRESICYTPQTRTQKPNCIIILTHTHKLCPAVGTQTDQIMIHRHSTSTSHNWLILFKPTVEIASSGQNHHSLTENQLTSTYFLPFCFVPLSHKTRLKETHFPGKYTSPKYARKMLLK